MLAVAKVVDESDAELKLEIVVEAELSVELAVVEEVLGVDEALSDELIVVLAVLVLLALVEIADADELVSGVELPDEVVVEAVSDAVFDSLLFLVEVAILEEISLVDELLKEELVPEELLLAKELVADCEIGSEGDGDVGGDDETIGMVELDEAPAPEEVDKTSPVP